MLTENLHLLLKMDKLGLKTISTAIDYLSIWEEYQKYNWIDNVSERKKVVADKCKVSISSVEKALHLMKQRW